jgi:hypothetical protein
MFIKEVIERIQSLYSKGVSSDESRLSDRHVYNKILSVRMQLLSQQLKKKQRISDWNYSILPCVELIKVPNHECPCLGDLGCDVYRTKFPIPRVMTDSNRHYIDFVMSVESGMRIEETTRQGVLYLKGNKYTGTKPKFLFENGYLYFPIQKSPGVVKIKLLAEDPLEAMHFPSLCDDCQNCTDCIPAPDHEFAIDGDLIEPLIDICVQEIIGIFGGRSEDKDNNSRDIQRPEGR